MAITINDEAPATKDERKLAGRWWNQEESDKAARRLHDEACEIERVSWPRRFLSLTCYRYMSGRPTSPQFNYAMTQRPGNVYAFYNAANWQPPAFNVMAQCGDFLHARIFKNRPFTQVTPLAGDLKADIKARLLSRWLDQQYHDLGLWPEIELCGIDSETFGSGFMKICRGLDGKIAKSRFLSDELLINEEEANYFLPPAVIQRVFAHREELLASPYGTTDEAARAIKNAKSVYPGFYYGAPLNTRDIVPFIEGWRLPTPDGKPGRHLIAIGQTCVLDEEWTRPRYPFARLIYKQLSTGYFGQGLAEQLLGLQREINRLFAAVWESNRRLAWPRVLVHMQSKVQESSLADKAGGIVKWAGTQPPQFVFPPFASKDQMSWLQSLIGMARERAGISEQSAAGSKPAGLTSGLAIEKWAMVEDTRHVDLAQRQEDFVTEISELLVDEGEVIKPKVKTPYSGLHQEIDWTDIDLRRDSYFLRAFPMSALPQTIGGRQQVIDTWWANGQIDKTTKMRLEQTYDLRRHEDLATASDDFIEYALADMLETGKFVPPEPFCDLTKAVASAQSHYMLQKMRGTPQARLDLLLQYASLAQDLADSAAPPPGVQPPAGIPAMPAQNVLGEPAPATPAQGA